MMGHVLGLWSKRMIPPPERQSISWVRMALAIWSTSFLSFGGVSAACGTSDQQATTFAGTAEDTIQLGANKRLVVQIGSDRAEYGPGDRIILRWIDGRVYVDSRQIRPRPDSGTPNVLPVERLKEMYGSVPLISQYVRDHRSEDSEKEVWNAASRLFASRLDDIWCDAGQRYRSLVQGDATLDRPAIAPDSAAALIARSLLQKTDVVSSVSVVKPPVRDSLDGFLVVVWKGLERVPEHVTLSGESSRSNVGSKEISKEMFNQLYGVPLRMLGQDRASMSIELIDGTMSVSRKTQPAEEAVTLPRSLIQF
jgi:hypothetical protein